MRSEATIGVRIHGIVAAMAVFVEAFTGSIRESYPTTGTLMKLLANIFTIVVAGSAFAPLIANGQTVIAGRTAGRAVVGNFQPLRPRFGISRPILQDFLRSRTSASAWKLSLKQKQDSSQSSLAHNVIIGALVGSAIGLGTGLLLDHTGKSGGTGSGEHITYSFEVYTIPIGAILGAVSGLLVTRH